MAIKYARGSPGRMALAWAGLIVCAYGGYFYVKKNNEMRKLEYMRKQANSDTKTVPEYMLKTAQGPTPIERMWNAMVRQWDK